MSMLWPRQCMTTNGTPAAATTGIIAGSARPPLTSLTSVAPAATACSATAARIVSTLTSDACRGQFADHGEHPAQLLGLVDPGGARAGGLAADVDQVGALGDQVEAVLDGDVRVEPPPAVGERVGRDVHHAHDRAAVPLRQSDGSGRTLLGTHAPQRRRYGSGDRTPLARVPRQARARRLARRRNPYGAGAGGRSARPGRKRWTTAGSGSDRVTKPSACMIAKPILGRSRESGIDQEARHPVGAGTSR